jgi:hypothetical protein
MQLKSENVNVQSLLLFIVLGILVCIVAFFVIKTVADFVMEKRKIMYKRYVMPILVSYVILLFHKRIEAYMKIEIPEEISVGLSLVILLVVMISIIFKLGLVKGICIFLVQSVSALMVVCTIYAGAVLFVSAFAIVIGFTNYPPKGIWLYADDGERILVRTKQDYFFDQYGRMYYKMGNVVVRDEDNKNFYLF